MKKRRRKSKTNRRKSATTQAATNLINQDINFPPDVPLPDPYGPTKNFRLAMHDPESFGESLRAQLWALWNAALHTPVQSVPSEATHAVSPQLGQKVRLELLKTAIHACNLLSHFDENEFKDSAPFEEGWPVVLAATRERARDWKDAEAKIKRLRAGMNHHSRLIPESDTELGAFLDFWTWRAMPELYELAPSPEELKRLPDRIIETLSSDKLLKVPRGLKITPETYQYASVGREWQDHPAVTAIFGKNKRHGVTWKEWKRYQKRAFVKDKLKAHARTLLERLKRFGRI
jgi:hypothetical protein